MGDCADLDASVSAAKSAWLKGLSRANQMKLSSRAPMSQALFQEFYTDILLRIL